MSIALYIIISIFSILLPWLFIPYVQKMLINANCMALNYKGDKIPFGMGIIIIPSILIVNGILYIYVHDIRVILITMGAVLMASIGIIDDVLGEKNIKGFKGHIRELLKGHLTTGGFKAIAGFISSFFISVIITSAISGSYIDILINTFIIALFTNLLNLMDLRPGRALKAFTLVFILLAIWANTCILYLIPIMGFVIAYFYNDIKAKSMLGDAGSNVLGMTLGTYIVFSVDLQWRLFVLILLLLIHIYAEKYSITKLIERNSVLNYLDKLGR